MISYLQNTCLNIQGQGLCWRLKVNSCMPYNFETSLIDWL
jgi:hypothetical protein